MSQRILNGNLALNRLINVKMKKKGKSGKEVTGLFIPIDANYLEENTYETRDGKVTDINIPVRVIVKDETDSKGQDGFVTKAIGAKTFKEATSEKQEFFKDYQNEEMQKVTPILGNIKDFSNSSAMQPKNDNSVSNEVVDADDDDLPF